MIPAMGSAPVVHGNPVERIRRRLVRPAPVLILAYLLTQCLLSAPALYKPSSDSIPLPGNPGAISAPDSLPPGKPLPDNAAPARAIFQESTETPTETPVPTDTETPTDTPVPTDTETPTETPTESPVPTPVWFIGGTTSRVNVSHIPGQDGDQTTAETYSPSVSDDGRFVAFLSWADNLAVNDPGGLVMLFL